MVFNSINEIESTYPNHIPKQVANIKQIAEKISTEELETYLKKYYNTEIYERNKSLNDVPIPYQQSIKKYTNYTNGE